MSRRLSAWLRSSRAYLAISHGAGNTNLTFVAEITLPGGASCPPPLAADFAITVNGTPMRLSLPDYSDVIITFSCTIHQLEGYATLPEIGARGALSSRRWERKASMVIAKEAPFPRSVRSRYRAPPCRWVNPSRWRSPCPTRICPRGGSSPFPGSPLSASRPVACPAEGWIGLVPTNAGAREGGLGFDVVVAWRLSRRVRGCWACICSDRHSCRPSRNARGCLHAWPTTILNRPGTSGRLCSTSFRCHSCDEAHLERGGHGPEESVSASFARLTLAALTLGAVDWWGRWTLRPVRGSCRRSAER